jgi:hypothetical protein
VQRANLTVKLPRNTRGNCRLNAKCANTAPARVPVFSGLSTLRRQEVLFPLLNACVNDALEQGDDSVECFASVARFGKTPVCGQQRSGSCDLLDSGACKADGEWGFWAALAPTG